MHKRSRQTKNIKLKILLIATITLVVIVSMFGAMGIYADVAEEGTLSNEENVNEVQEEQVEEELPDPEDENWDFDAIFNGEGDAAVFSGDIDNTDDSTDTEEGGSEEGGSDEGDDDIIDDSGEIGSDGSSGTRYCGFVGFRNKKAYNTYVTELKNGIWGTNKETLVSSESELVKLGSTNKKYPTKPGTGRGCSSSTRSDAMTDEEKEYWKKKKKESEEYMKNAGYWYNPKSKVKHKAGSKLILEGIDGSYRMINIRAR